MAAAVTVAGGGVHRIRIADPERWPDEPVPMELTRSTDGTDGKTDATRLSITANAGMRFSLRTGRALLEGAPGGWFGLSGRRWLFRFRQRPGMRFYGLGEKHTPFERSGRAYWFWNTDVWADHPMAQVREGDYDPDYMSIPYLAIKQGNTYIGLLVDTLFPSWISLGTHAPAAGAFGGSREARPELVLGGTGGA